MSGRTSAKELVSAVGALHEKDPRKEIPDLWLISEESMVPLAEFPGIVASIGGLLSDDLVGCRSAMVVPNELFLRRVQMYQAEAKSLPYELGVFLSHQEALDWLKS